MRLLVLDVQSISDVVTNSSSEVFILNTDKTCEEVNNILKEFTYGFRFPEIFHLEDYRKWRESTKNKEDDFHYPYTLYEFIKGWFIDSEIEEDMVSHYRSFLFCPWRYESVAGMNFECFGIDSKQQINIDFLNYINNHIKEIKEEIGDSEFDGYDNYEDFYYDKYCIRWELPDHFILDFMNSYTGIIPEELKISDRDNVINLDGKVLVLSENDNTIPYDSWDKIRTLFNGYNVHLG